MRYKSYAYNNVSELVELMKGITREPLAVKKTTKKIDSAKNDSLQTPSASLSQAACEGAHKQCLCATIHLDKGRQQLS
jgi:hypothetical protein